MSWRAVVIAAALGAFGNSIVLAQSGTSAIAGLVSDESGAPVPGVLVRVVNEATGVAVDAVSNQLGIYRASALVPGTYRVEASIDGFDPVARRGVRLEDQSDPGARRDAERRPSIGDHRGEREQVGGRVTERERQSDGDARDAAGIAVPNRAASSLVALAPGVVMIDTGAGTAENYPVFTAAGGRPRNQVSSLTAATPATPWV